MRETTCSIVAVFIVFGALGPASAQGPSVVKLLKQADQLARETSRLRGLRRRRPISMGVVTRKQILQRVRERLNQDYTDQEIANDSLVLKRLGLLPLALDYRQAVLDLLTDQIGGFYDPRRQELNIAAWLPLAMQRPALVHEICHALQDQHFRLKRFVVPLKENSDRQLAQAALVEGDCSGVMIEHLLLPTGRELGMLGPVIERFARGLVGGQGSSVFRKASPFLREVLTFPYLYGLKFIQHLRAKHRWSMVDKVFARPPTTTEQIMHPQKYHAAEQPILVRVGATPKGFALIKRDTLGEFQLMLLLKLKLGADSAHQAVAGWGGDRLAAYLPEGVKDGTLPMILMLSVWDSEQDAQQFETAQRKLFVGRVGRLQPSVAPSDTLVDAEGRYWRVVRRKNAVLSIIGAPSGSLADLEPAVWKTWRIGAHSAERSTR
ncbi:MAG: hypothetical protein H6707_14170 [Deltaproteobacteria bacterium]|nr:hypothetical protein [Deltaproteobacteria bacterium]